MLLSGVEFLASQVARGPFSAKMVFNANGALFFRADQQHRDQKASGISYEDDYAGNALAAMLSPGKVEIRWHRDFSDQRVAEIIGALLAQPPLSFMKGWQVTYQGRALAPAT